MPWTSPKTDWENGELVTADDLNAVGENLTNLKDSVAEEASKTLNAASGGSRQSLEISTGKALIMATIRVVRRGNDFQLAVDGRGVGLKIRADSSLVHLSHIEKGLSPGTHVFSIVAHRGSNNHVEASYHLSVAELA